jgi:hypothetical protein
MARWIERLGDVWDRWRIVGLATLAAGFGVVGSRVRLPGLSSQGLGDLLQRLGPQASLYDLLAGGATSRGSILALGLLPYVSARIWMQIARLFNKRLDAYARTDEGGDKVRHWTRVLTVALSVAQSIGFAMLVQRIPGAVVNPGWRFAAQTILILTSGTVVTMLLTEGLLGRLRSSASSRAARGDELPSELAKPSGDLGAPVLGPFDGKLLQANAAGADELLQSIATARRERVIVRRGADSRDEPAS